MLKNATKIIIVILLFFGNVRAIAIFQDKEIDDFIGDVIKSYKKATHINYDITIYTVQDDNVNAFVIDSEHIFINSGTIITADNTSELAGIIAHELGHIKENHIALTMQRSHVPTAITGVASAAALILLVSSAVITGGLSLVPLSITGAVAFSSAAALLAMRVQYTREQEQQADNVAFQILHESGYSVKGMVSFFDKMSRQERKQYSNYNSGTDWVYSHPIAYERMLKAKEVLDKEEKHLNNFENFEKRFQMVKAKTFAITRNADYTYKKYNGNDAVSIYARSFADFKNKNYSDALKKNSIILKQEPKNEYFLDARAMFLSNLRKFKEANDIYKDLIENYAQYDEYYYQMAVNYWSMGDKASLNSAVKYLNILLDRNPKRANGWYLKYLVLKKLDRKNEAYVAKAEYYLGMKKYEQALEVAKYVASRVEKNSMLWLQSNDIISYTKRVLKLKDNSEQ